MPALEPVRKNISSPLCTKSLITNCSVTWIVTIYKQNIERRDCRPCCSRTRVRCHEAPSGYGRDQRLFSRGWAVYPGSAVRQGQQRQIRQNGAVCLPLRTCDLWESCRCRLRRCNKCAQGMARPGRRHDLLAFGVQEFRINVHPILPFHRVE